MTVASEYSTLRKQLCPNIHIEFVSKEDFAELTSFLDIRWNNTKPEPQTHQVHCVKSHGSDSVQVCVCVIITLHRFNQQLQSLKSKTWRCVHILILCQHNYLLQVHVQIQLWICICRDKKLRLFLCENNEFLCNMYDLSGANGTSVGVECYSICIYLLIVHFQRVG